MTYLSFSVPKIDAKYSAMLEANYPASLASFAAIPLARIILETS